MKALVIIGSVVLWTSYVVVSGFVSIFTGPLPGSDLAVMLTAGSTVAVIGSALLVGVLSSNAVDPSEERGRRYLRRISWVAGATFATSVALTIASSILRQAPLWVPLTLIALTIVCTLGPVAAAESYRRGQKPASAESWQAPVSERARTFTRMGITFVVAAVVVAVTLVILNVTLSSDIGVLEILEFSLAVGAIAAIVPGMVTTFRSAASVNQIFGTDIDSRKAVTRAVLRGRPVDLSDTQVTMASRFAHAMHDALPVQYVQTGLILLGLVGLQLPRILRGDVFPFVDSLYIVVGLGYIVVLVIAWRQYRSVRAYAIAHPLDEPAAAI